ncbi:MAG: site-specific DNA-methyltransferase [Deltaproteobacteria bacterium]|nr:site-specific DNA-methyltransferase [Deltaproteobacteria bacterium]
MQNTAFINQQFDKEFPSIIKKDGRTQTGVSWTVYTGDAYDVLQRLPGEGYNCVITSPPYFWLRDYGVERQIGLEETVRGYVKSICAVMDETFRALAKDGVLFLNIGDTYYSGKGKSHGVDRKSRKRRFGLRSVDKSGGLGIGLKPKTLIGIPWRVATEMIGRGWILRSPIIWYRKHSLPESVKDRPRRSYEHVFMFTKSRRYYFNRQTLEDAEQEDMWTIVARPKTSNGLGTAPFPDELVQRCLDIGCPSNGKVLDPFAGSGTTLRVAIQNGKEATGIDLNPDFCEYMINDLQKL